MKIKSPRVHSPILFILGISFFLAFTLYFAYSFSQKVFWVTPSPTPIPTLISQPISDMHVSPSPSVFLLEKETVLVKRVIDGDTIELTDGRKVRYIGINTPETVDPRRSVQCFGHEAAEMNKEIVQEKEVILIHDVSNTDKYARLLRYVYIGDLFVNDYLVREGYARASTFPPDVTYAEQFVEAEKEARENDRGLWKSCPTK